MKVLDFIGGIILVFCVGFSLFAVGHGKVGDLFGTEIFIAAAGDMKATFVLLLASMGFVLYLLTRLFILHSEVGDRQRRIDEWERWHADNAGKII